VIVDAPSSRSRTRPPHRRRAPGDLAAAVPPRQATPKPASHGPHAPLPLLPPLPPLRESPAHPARRSVGGLKARLALAAILALIGGVPRPVAAAADFIVVVNAGNRQAALPAAEISNMFLQKSTQWQPGERVMAVDLPEGSPARESFSKAIHNRSTAAVKAYWQRMIFSGRDVPPPEKPTPGDVLAYVKGNPGAIGYVPAGTPLPDGVKALKVTP
jgi:hypothetical protein